MHKCTSCVHHVGVFIGNHTVVCAKETVPGFAYFLSCVIIFLWTTFHETGAWSVFSAPVTVVDIYIYGSHWGLGVGFHDDKRDSKIA